MLHKLLMTTFHREYKYCCMLYTMCAFTPKVLTTNLQKYQSGGQIIKSIQIPLSDR